MFGTFGPVGVESNYSSSVTLLTGEDVTLNDEGDERFDEIELAVRRLNLQMEEYSGVPGGDTKEDAAKRSARNEQRKAQIRELNNEKKKIVEKSIRTSRNQSGKAVLEEFKGQFPTRGHYWSSLPNPIRKAILRDERKFKAARREFQDRQLEFQKQQLESRGLYVPPHLRNR